MWFSPAARWIRASRHYRNDRIDRIGRTSSLRIVMCGICGVVQLRGESREVIAPVVLDSMTDVMTHRGPNDRGTLHRPRRRHRCPTALDRRRRRRPPAGDERARDDRRRAERGALQPRPAPDTSSSRTGTSSEVGATPRCFRISTRGTGQPSSSSLRGKFGLVVWDATERRAVIARDRLGVKPLYWAVADDRVVFASELKSLWRAASSACPSTPTRSTRT